jgi:hypothetical protein
MSLSILVVDDELHMTELFRQPASHDGNRLW